MKKAAALLMIFFLLAGCGTVYDRPVGELETASAGVIKISGKPVEKVLRIGCRELDGVFSPLWAVSDGDRMVSELVNVPLLTIDRRGEVLCGAADGETREYNGTEYAYFGPADLEIERNGDGAVYTWRLRDDLRFSDGEPLTADDLIFSCALVCDPDYDGACGFGTLDIEGLDAYRTGTGTEIYEKYKALAEGFLENPSETPDEREKWFFETAMELGWENECRHITRYCRSMADEYSGETGYTAEALRGSENLSCAFAMVMWGFGEFRDGRFLCRGTGEECAPEDVDLRMFVREARCFCPDPEEFMKTEGTGDERESITECAIREFITHWGGMEQTGNAVISGLEKLDDHTVAIRTKSYKASDIFRMDIPILPLHYYGNVEEFASDEGKYGFEQGNLEKIRQKSVLPVGAGPYSYKSCDGTTAVLTANRFYAGEEPAAKEIRITALGASPSGIFADDFDLCFAELTDTNVDSYAYESGGYGYIGINAEQVKVGEPFSEKSRSLRMALSAVIAACREDAANYYGKSAVSTAARISADSWAYSGGGIAYSRDDAAAAAIGYLRGAGYQWEAQKGKFTAAPEGASLCYTILIPGGGKGEHPALKTAEEAAKLLGNIGIELTVSDVTPTELMTALEDGSVQLWAAAWNATPDPDLYQIFSSENRPGSGTGLNYYRLSNPELDVLLLQGRTTMSYELRREIYERASALIDREAVEIPLYRRRDAVYFGQRVDSASITPATEYYPPVKTVQDIKMK